MTTQELSTLATQEIADRFQEAVQCIRDNRENKDGGLPKVYINHTEFTWEITGISINSYNRADFIGTDGSIEIGSYDRNFTGCF